jgi:hypothetical protein
MVVVSARDGSASALVRVWRWLTECAADGCRARPVRLGRCERHAATDPGSQPDEFWG